jgi:hypothetical protein
MCSAAGKDSRWIRVWPETASASLLPPGFDFKGFARWLLWHGPPQRASSPGTPIGRHWTGLAVQQQID